VRNHALLTIKQRDLGQVKIEDLLLDQPHPRPPRSRQLGSGVNRNSDKVKNLQAKASARVAF
jgi:hypothetical protein